MQKFKKKNYTKVCYLISNTFPSTTNDRHTEPFNIQSLHFAMANISHACVKTLELYKHSFH